MVLLLLLEVRVLLLLLRMRGQLLVGLRFEDGLPVLLLGRCVVVVLKVALMLTVCTFVSRVR